MELEDQQPEQLSLAEDSQPTSKLTDRRRDCYFRANLEEDKYETHNTFASFAFSSPAPSSDPKTPDPGANIYLCGTCGQPITVTLIATNSFLAPFFEINATVKAKPQRELIHFLEDAAVQDPKFKYFYVI